MTDNVLGGSGWDSDAHASSKASQSNTGVRVSARVCVAFIKGLIQECIWYKIINSKKATRTF